MPTNLPAEAKAKWIKVMEAKTPEEKLKALEEFLSAVPKHKGTENLVHWVRRRIAQLRKEIELRKQKERMLRAKGATTKRIYVEKDGDIQLVIVGPPLSGKSSLLKCLTNVKIEPDEIPYTDTEPIPGMFIHENIYIQLVKTPSLNLDDFESDLNVLTTSLIRNADGIVLILDPTQDDLVNQFEKIKSLLKNYGILITKPKALIRIEKKSIMGIQIIGKLVGTDIESVKKLLLDYGIRGAVIHIEGEATLDDIEEHILREYVYKPCIVLINKIDLVDKELIKSSIDTISREVPVLTTSLLKCDICVEDFVHKILSTLRLIRVYTKEIHSDTYSKKPFIVKEGTTVGDLAKMIHSELYERFKYAKVWKTWTYPHQYKRVGINYILEDFDVVEIHA